MCTISPTQIFVVDNLLYSALPPFSGHLTLKSLDLRNIPFQALVSFLSIPTQAIPSGIRILQVSLRPAKYEATFDTKNQPEWRKIDQALKTRKFEHFDAFVIWTAPAKGGDVLYENLRIACEGALPKAYESGVLCWGNLNTRIGTRFDLVTCISFLIRSIALLSNPSFQENSDQSHSVATKGIVHIDMVHE